MDSLHFVSLVARSFALMLPFLLAYFLVQNRHHLHRASTRAKIGFLYARYVPGAESWGEL